MTDVLLVDDEDDNLEVLCEYLGLKGLDVVGMAPWTPYSIVRKALGVGPRVRTPEAYYWPCNLFSHPTQLYHGNRI